MKTGKFRLPARGKERELGARGKTARRPRRLQVAKGHDNVSIVHVRSHTGDVARALSSAECGSCLGLTRCYRDPIAVVACLLHA